MTDLSPILRHTQSYGRTRAGDPLPLKSQPETVAHMTAQMIDQYVTWLNLWGEANDNNDSEPYQYAPRNFTDNQDGEVTPVATYETNYYQVLVLNVYDGDDGGATTLTGYFHDNSAYGSHTQATDGLSWHMTQEFDTCLQLIVNEGNFVNTPETSPETSLPPSPTGNF